MKEISNNFGAIKDTVSKLSSAEILKKSESVTLDRFINEVKESPAFFKQNLLYKNFEDCKPFEKERLAERFISQNLRMLNGLNWHEILRENKRLRKELLNDIHVEASSSSDLFESVNVLIESQTKPGFSDFHREQEAYENVISHLTRKVVEESDKSDEKEDNPSLTKNAWKFITKNAVSNFHERYNHLNEGEREIFKILISEGNTKEVYLETLKEEAKSEIERISKEGSKDDIDFVKGFVSKIENIDTKDYQKIDESIIACAELKQHLKDL